ncbi:MAG: 3-hydroxybutyryl-CoA dehydrogenase [Kouleothrix sp.]|nr:3-hydroxybutyryl-CoA dehydrogenase [Kouleothrix sp.]
MRIGVAGAGVMGVGVAQSLAQAGHRIVLVDVAEHILDRARAEIRKSLRMYKMLNKDSLPEGVEAALARIAFTTDYALFHDVDVVIENVVEKWAIKKLVYETIDPICPRHCVFAANTSAISITRIASATSRPDRVIGMHFMNPVPMKPMVEVIPGYHTTESTIQMARELLSTMGKDCVIVHDMPGFVSNRVLMLTINEAIFLVQDNVASAADIDTIFKSCFGHKMGPLETADLIGLDTILYSIEVLYESYNDSKYRPCPLLRQMVDAGLYGRKSGRGFYVY